MELTLDQALKRGIDAHKAGRLQEAERYYTAILKTNPAHSDANHNMGVLAVGVGKVSQALPFFKTAIASNPRVAQFWISYIDALIKLGNLLEARKVLKKARTKFNTPDSLKKFEGLLFEHKGQFRNKNAVAHEAPLEKIKILNDQYVKGELRKTLDDTKKLLVAYPNSALLHLLSGLSNAGLGYLDTAIESYNQAISIKPDFAEAFYNMGLVLTNQNKLNKAINAYKKVISISPNYPDTYNNMGVALTKLSKFDEAIEAFKKAIALNADYVEAYNNMANTLKSQKKLEEALNAYSTAISLRPDYIEAYYNISALLTNIAFKKRPNSKIKKIIISILDSKTYVRPAEISAAVISLLKLEPEIKNFLSEHANGSLEENLIKTVRSLSKEPLLLKFMSICPIIDLELEGAFKNIRSLLLSYCEIGTNNDTIFQFQSALALQCYTNEYIYCQEEREDLAVNRLEKLADEALSKGHVLNSQTILCLASYKSLSEYAWCNQITSTQEIADVLTRQVYEPNKEKHLRNDIPLLARVSDEVSSNVKAQYEKNPYPRWVNLGLQYRPYTIPEAINELKLKIFDQTIYKVDKPRILIAGCGTGQHSITTAARFKNSELLAIDLSLSSLAYAKRKSTELAIENITYMQADILTLHKLQEQFDIIESV